MQIEELPHDPAMLLSFVNMKLRDEFDGSLDEMCKALGVDNSVLIDIMAKAGWEFNAAGKKFW